MRIGGEQQPCPLQVVKRVSDGGGIHERTALHRVKRALAQGHSDLRLKDVDHLIGMLLDRRQQLEKEGARSTLELLLRFLLWSREQRQAALQSLLQEEGAIERDKDQVDSKREHLGRLRERQRAHALEYQSLQRRLGAHQQMRSGPPALAFTAPPRPAAAAGAAAGLGHAPVPQEDAARMAVVEARRRRAREEIHQLREAYKRLRLAQQPASGPDAPGPRPAPEDGLESFASAVSTFLQYSGLRCIAQVVPSPTLGGGGCRSSAPPPPHQSEP